MFHQNTVISLSLQLSSFKCALLLVKYVNTSSTTVHLDCLRRTEVSEGKAPQTEENVHIVRPELFELRSFLLRGNIAKHLVKSSLFQLQIKIFIGFYSHMTLPLTGSIQIKLQKEQQRRDPSGNTDRHVIGGNRVYSTACTLSCCDNHTANFQVLVLCSVTLFFNPGNIIVLSCFCYSHILSLYSQFCIFLHFIL